jgi:TPR repeat protein
LQKKLENFLSYKYNSNKYESLIFTINEMKNEKIYSTKKITEMAGYQAPQNATRDFKTMSDYVRYDKEDLKENRWKNLRASTQYNIGLFYKEGYGVTQNHTKALNYLSLAVRNGRNGHNNAKKEIENIRELTL